MAVDKILASLRYTKSSIYRDISGHTVAFGQKRQTEVRTESAQQLSDVV